ncbi:MAG TPA: hypothetical protein VN538_09110 [Clostridia bacterium]|nr:hypothetical protein [Clostridia bacterium]
MKRREMKLLLEERFERIALLETRIDTLDQLVEGYRVREQSIFNTLTAAKENAAKALEQAKAEGAQIIAEADAVRAEAEKIRKSAADEAEALLAKAILTATTLKEEAERKGNEMTADIRADSERMFKDAQIIKREYEEMVESFNAMLEQNASELEITAARFAEFVKNRKIDRSESRLDGDAFYKSVGEMNEPGLPDSSENPAVLMQNIYRMQNRPLPEDRLENMEHAESTAFSAEPAKATIESTEEKPAFPMEDGSGADERRMNEPFSAAAWANDALRSESEPQAEFTRVFDPDYVQSDYTIQQDACAVSQEETQSVFDELVTDQQTAAPAVAIPLGSAVVAARMGDQPLAETVRTVDEYFDTAFEPSGKKAQDEVPPEQAEGPQGAAPEVAAPAAMPEPYSEQLWAQSDVMSDLEPQAEGTLFADVNAEAEQAAEAIAAAPAPLEATQPEPKPAAVSKQLSPGEMSDALDDYFDQIDVYAPTMPKAPDAAPAAAPSPYSEKAWVHSSMMSDLEPQAEGTLFDNVNASLPDFVPASAAAAGQFVPTAHGIFEINAPVSASEAEHAFDDYLNLLGKGEPAAAVEPYSQTAWEQSALASDHEPQAEGALFADVNAYEPTFTPAAGAPVEEKTTAPKAAEAGTQETIDDMLSQIDVFAPSMPRTPEIAPATAPEPYSAEAWAYTPNVSEYEPQAEGASIVAVQEPEEEEEPEPAPNKRKYNEYGEIREWEPEPEPDMGDIPTVSRYMGQSASSDDISLDDLLDEIIKAGD